MTTMKVEKWFIDKQPEYIYKDLIVRKENLLTPKKVLKIFAGHDFHNINGSIVYQIEVGEDNTTYISSALKSLGMESTIIPLKVLKAKGLINLLTDDKTLYVELKKEFIGDVSSPEKEAKEGLIEMLEYNLKNNRKYAGRYTESAHKTEQALLKLKG